MTERFTLIRDWFLKGHRLSFSIFLLFFIFFSQKIISDFSGPIFGYADVAHWNYNAYYFSKYLSFNGLYFKLDLMNNESFFPVGTVQSFQSWGLEKDILNFGFFKIFGPSPFLKYYALFSISLSYFGFYFLLSSRFSKYVSILPALAASFISYYSVLKYPYHYSFLIHHWTGLSICMDFLIFDSLLRDRKISLNYIFLRIGFLFLSFGEDLTYVTSFGLLSFVITSLFVFGKISLNRKEIRWDFSLNRKILFFFLLSGLVFFVYEFPIILQILFSLKGFSSDGFVSAFWWSQPLRILTPILPKWNVLNSNISELFQDEPDGLASLTVSSILLVIWIYSLLSPKKEMKSLFPVITLVMILISYHPTYFPYLNEIPWFRYYRVSARASFVYSIVFGLFALYPDYQKILSSRVGKITALLLLFIFLWEVKTVYSHKPQFEIKLTKDNLDYFEKIKQRKGQAVLDWPFCIFGADGDERLCPYFVKTANQYAQRQFHGKKSISQYFGRIHTSQKEIFLKDGWDHLFLKEESNPFFPKQSRCWNEAEWKFFLNFYRSHDFAGIQLNEDILPDSCKEEFYKRAGAPLFSTQLEMSGKLVFIPK